MLYHPELIVYLWLFPLFLWVVAPLLFSPIGMLLRFIIGEPVPESAAERGVSRVSS
ncbi:MAG: hypothetical protein M0P70_00550 [Desulfobulbaceae bacterium]|nr:hypothetical protein [Desulfobulbaceae bacterium]